MESEPHAHRPRILVFANRFAETSQGRWLQDELADAIVHSGCDVEVAFLDRSGAGRRDFGARHPVLVRHYFIPALLGRTDNRLLRLALLVPLVFAMTLRELGRALFSRYDAVVVFSIGSQYGPAPVLLKASRRASRMAYVLWDFFPGHHVQIGSVPGWLAPPLKVLEQTVALAADRVLVMSDANRNAAVAYFDVDPVRVRVSPPWGESLPEPVRGPVDGAPGPLMLVFGGQQGRGRDLRWLFQQLRTACDRGLELNLRLIGGRSRESEVLADEIGLPPGVVTCLPWMSRSDYLECLRSADVGLVVTDAGVRFPTFPSKLVDYFRVGIPALVALEAASDVPAMVERLELGRGCSGLDQRSFQLALDDLVAAKREGRLQIMGQNAQHFFEREMHVQVAAKRLLSMLRDR